MFKKMMSAGLALMLCLTVIMFHADLCRGETGDDVSLTIEYKNNDVMIRGAKFDIYKVADITGDMEYSLTGSFKDYAVSLDNLDSQGWRDAAVTLSGYVSRDAVVPSDSGSTNSQGLISFPNKSESLEQGLYLVVGKKCTQSGYTYTCEPFMVCLPNRDADGYLEYDVKAMPKSERKRNSRRSTHKRTDSTPTPTPTPKTTTPDTSTSPKPQIPQKPEKTSSPIKHPDSTPESSVVPSNPDVTIQPGGEESKSETTDIKVVKVWNDKNYGNKRAESVEVQLLRDNVIYDTVTLSKSNNWRHIWNDLSDLYTWQVVEKTVPNGYTVSVNKEGITYTLTNTYQDTDSKSSRVRERTPNIPGSEDSEDSSNVSEEDEKLPQTGQLWWPVPVMTFMGMTLFVFGWIRYRKYGERDE